MKVRRNEAQGVSLRGVAAICLLLRGALVLADGSDAACTEANRACRDWTLDVVYTGDFWRNAHGGLEQGSSFLDNLDVVVEIDGERAWGVEGLTLLAYGLYNNGGTISADLVGSAQGTSNIEAVDTVRLYELWADWAFGAGQARSLRLGLYDLNSEFDANGVGSLFVHPGHGIGTDLGQTGENGPSIFPVTSPALRYRHTWARSDTWVLQLAVLDATPGDPDHATSHRMHVSADELLLIGELQRNGTRLSKVAVGYWRYTSEFDDLVRVDASGAPARHDGNAGVYLLAEAALSEDAAATHGLFGFLRFGVADDRVNQFDQYLGIGLVHRGVFARHDDQIGLAVASARNGAAFREAGVRDGLALEDRETAIELSYRAPLTDWLTLQPDVQYVIHPSTDATLDDAWVFGLRVELALP